MKIENKYKTHYIRKNVFVNIVILLSVVLTYILICKFIIYKTKYKQKENAYDLSISKYKEEVYEEIKYDEPKVILDKLHSMEENISKGIEELKEIIG